MPLSSEIGSGDGNCGAVRPLARRDVDAHPAMIEVATSADLAGILDPSVNLCVWRRPERAEITALASRVAGSLGSRSRFVFERDDGGMYQAVTDFLPAAAWDVDRRAASAWRDDVLSICELFANCVEAAAAVVVLEGPSEATCPRFHVDRVGIRMLVTYSGPGTEWLEESDVDRRWLGAAGDGLPDDQDGVLRDGAEIRSLPPFSVALFKGEAWPGAERRGVVHRSPDPCGAPRVLLRVDALMPDE